MRLETSTLGRNSLELLLAGPISDTVGYTVNINVDEYAAPDDWESTEGLGPHESTTEYFDGKLKFTPSEVFDAEISFSHLVTDDGMPIEVDISPQAYAACVNFPSPNLVGVNWIQGTFDCDVSLPVGGIPTNTDTAAPYAGTPDELLARAFSVSDPGVYTARNRIQGEFTFGLANDTTIQVLGFVLEEQKEWWNDTDRSDAPVNIVNGMLAMGMQPIGHMASPADTDELASQFGFTVVPNVIFSEDSKNVGVFGSINYDISDSTTFSFEGRWQNEDLTNINPITNEAFTNSTDSFLPRVALTHTLDNNVTLDAQASKGNNPAGVIPAARSPRTIQSHAQATALGLVNWSLDSTLLYEEEEITNLEFGVKATLAENRVTLASTIYTMDWENYNQPFTLNWNINTLWRQSGNPGPSPGLLAGFGNGDYMLRAQLNAGDASVLGWENEGRWLANDDWTAIRGGNSGIMSDEPCPTRQPVQPTVCPGSKFRRSRREPRRQADERRYTQYHVP